MKVLLVDDHPLILSALQTVIKGLGDDVSVLGAGSAAEARTALEQDSNYDLVLLDLALGDADGFELLVELRAAYPALPVVVVSASDRTSDVIRAIEAAARGEATLDASLTQRVFNEMRRSIQQEESAAFSDLTAQEMQVLSLIAEGRTNREIAEALYLSEGTVRNYVSGILSKLEVSNRAEAAAYAIQHHLKDYLN